MDWLALLFDIWGTHRLRSVFEEGVLAHQPQFCCRLTIALVDSSVYRSNAFINFFCAIRAEGNAPRDEGPRVVRSMMIEACRFQSLTLRLQRVALKTIGLMMPLETKLLIVRDSVMACLSAPHWEVRGGLERAFSG